MIQLFRPELPLAAGLCVVVGQILASGRLPPVQIGILGFMCGFALSSSALILNDYFDLDVDRINAPNRPLPSGAVSRPEVIGLTAATSLVGLGSAALLGMDALWIGILFWLIGFLYNWRYKRTGLPGNLMVSASVAVTFVLGAITMQAPWSRIVWTFSLMAFFFDLGEEIGADAMDMEGDKQRGSRSIALLKGKRFALQLCVALWSLVILVSLLPALLGWLGVSYLVIILIDDALLVFFSIRLLRSPNEVTSRQALRGAYLGLSLAVIAILMAQFVHMPDLLR